MSVEHDVLLLHGMSHACRELLEITFQSNVYKKELP
jgi:hypothetical protein